MTTDRATPNRLGISHLMMLTTGIGIAFFVSRGIEHLRFPADAHYYNLASPSNVDALGMFIASIYGLCVTMFVIAIRDRDFWSSPGKTLALLFATMCLLNWSLEIIAATVTHVRMQTDLAFGTNDHRGFVLGIWYRDFAASVGYVACLPVLLWVVLKTRTQPVAWRIAWIGFLIFALLIIGDLHFGLRNQVGLTLRPWYFEIAIGIPICLLMLAVADSFARRRPMDWWTVLTAIPVASVWCIGIAIRLLG